VRDRSPSPRLRSLRYVEATAARPGSGGRLHAPGWIHGRLAILAARVAVGEKLFEALIRDENILPLNCSSGGSNTSTRLSNKLTEHFLIVYKLAA
jgi:hypothetical protein